MQEFLDTMYNWAITQGIRILIAIILLFVSFALVNWLGKVLLKSFEKKNIDKTISRTLVYVIKLVAKCIIAVCLIGYVGIDTSAITALIASFGVCIGLAVNGALSNLAGGVLIIVTRPFRIDDFIEAQGVSGTVEEIRITMTKIKTPDNKVVFIPNGPLSSGTIVNYSMKDTRRVDFVFSIGYQNDFGEAKNIVSDILASHELVLDDPATFVRVSKHGESAIEITARAWVKSADYWTVNFDVIEAVKKAFDEKGIEIPFNQLDVHIKEK